MAKLREAQAPLVVSTLPHNRLAASRMDFPPGWEVRYLGDREEEFSQEVIAAAGQDADFLLCTPYPKITASLIAKLPALRMIQMVGAGYDNVDIEAAARAGVVVANSPGANATTVAEFTLACAILLKRRMLEGDWGIKQGNYETVRESLLAEGLEELFGSYFGIVGLGSIGKEVARLARALGAKVIYYDLEQKPLDVDVSLGAIYKPFSEFLKVADVVTLHVPLTPKTRHLIGEEELKMMKHSAVLINTSRGGVVDEQALVRAVSEGWIAAAAVDTFTVEPLPQGHPFMSLPEEIRPRLLLTPHLAGVTRQAFARMLQNAIDNIARVARGEPARHVVNGVTVPRRKPS